MRHFPALTRLAPVALAAALGGPCSAAPLPPTPDPDAQYQALLAAAKANPGVVDWGRLRLAYANRPSFKVFAQSAAKRRMFEAANASNCPEALKQAKAVLADDYIDADAHFLAAFCEDAAGDAQAARLDRMAGGGLIKSIQTGDGLSPATAFTVISVDEEYALLRALGAKVQEQSLVQQDGHAYDRLEVLATDGRKSAYYFAVDRLLAAEAAAMTPGAVTEGGPPGRTP
ncbi:MAG TPA: DUF4919 domain-containing protein [Caulobacteraceae bacterium]|jgi:hypothetical protein|nr:DUF4919 domain-containing protein [Caulobacteraceae bacterium]